MIGTCRYKDEPLVVLAVCGVVGIAVLVLVCYKCAIIRELLGKVWTKICCNKPASVTDQNDNEA